MLTVACRLTKTGLPVAEALVANPAQAAAIDALDGFCLFMDDEQTFEAGFRTKAARDAWIAKARSAGIEILQF